MISEENRKKYYEEIIVPHIKALDECLVERKVTNIIGVISLLGLTYERVSSIAPNHLILTILNYSLHELLTIQIEHTIRESN